MAKKIYSSDLELYYKLLTGIEFLSENVACTLGPRGRNVILKNASAKPYTTKDGVTVARFLEHEDPTTNLGVQIVKQASIKTNDMVGDGTTTSIVLSYALFKRAYKYLISGVYPNEICKGIGMAVEELVAAIERSAIAIKSLEDIANVAAISANGDQEVGNFLATAVDSVGKNGSITIEEARSTKTSLQLIDGFRFNSGYLSPSFITNERKGAAKYDRPMFLVTDFKIDTIDDMLPSLEIASREGRPFIIVADDITGQALAALIMNAVRGTMKVIGIKAPKYGEERRQILQDLALSTGAMFMTRESGKNLRDIKLTDFGSAQMIEVLNNETTVVGGRGNLKEIEKNIESLKEQIRNNDDMHECELIQERITRLASGVAIIKIGASSEIEMIEKKHRYEDALEAIKCAKEKGIIPGGGTFLIKLAYKLKYKGTDSGERIGYEIVKEAVKDPLRKMLENAGKSSEIVLEKLVFKKGNIGYDVYNEKFVDMLDAGVLDPAQVTVTTLRNAASVVVSLLMASHAAIELD